MRHDAHAVVPVRRKGVVLRPHVATTGYPTVALDVQKPICVHALVCEAFHGPRPHGYQVAHGDGSRTNNHFLNLRWASPSENNRDKAVHGTAQDMRGEKGPCAKLRNSDVIEIKTLLGLESQASLARRYKVDPSTINNIASGKHWSHLNTGGA